MSKHTFDIELSGKSYTCRTTFEAIDSFEDQTGVSISEAWQSLAEGKLKFKFIAAAVWAGINGERAFRGEKPLLYATVGQTVQEHGFMKAAIYASKFFANSLPPSEDAAPVEGDEKKSSE